MNVTNIFEDLTNEDTDTMNKDKDLDINTIFKVEKDLIDELNNLEDKSKNLDLIFFNYDELKNRISKKRESTKEKLVKLNIQKEEFDNTEAKKKSIYLNKEFMFYKDLTNTKNLIAKIKGMFKKIDILKGNLKNRKLTLEYNKIKEKYKEIMIFVNSEKFDNKSDIIPNNLSIEEKNVWYEQKIEEYIEKKMIFDNYLFLLENYYSDLLNKKISNITFSKESV